MKEMMPPLKLIAIVILLYTAVNGLRKTPVNRDSLIERLAEANGITGVLLAHDRRKRSGGTVSRLLYGATSTGMNIRGGQTYHKFADYSQALFEFQSLKPRDIARSGDGLVGAVAVDNAGRKQAVVSLEKLRGERAKIEIYFSNPFINPLNPDIIIDYDMSKIYP